MSVEIFWRLPLDGDGRSISVSERTRGDFAEANVHSFARTGAPRDGYNYHDLVLRIGRAAELNSFDGLWLPESETGEDPFIVAASLAREVPRLSLVPALRAPLLSAVYATKIAVSFQRLTAGRLRWNLVVKDDSNSQAWHGRRWDSIEQLARTAEFLDVAKGFWHNPPFSYQGRYYEVVDGGFADALQGESFPIVYLGGTSDDALALSAKHADVHIFPIAPRRELSAHIATLRTLAQRAQRTVRVGIETDVLGRHTDDGAWTEAQRQARGASKVEEHLWSGFGELKRTSELGLVGGYGEIAHTLTQYRELGVDTFILGANPHIEEAYRLGEHLLPLVHQAHQSLAHTA